MGPWRMPGGFGGGTVEILRKIRLGKRRPWKLRLGNRGTVEEFAGRRGKPGELPWKNSGGELETGPGLELEDR